MTSVGFIGTGEIAAPMVRALAAKGLSLIVSRRNETISKALSRAYENVRVADNQDVLDQADVIFLCLRAAAVRDVLANLTFRAAHSVISVMASVPMADLRQLCAPAAEISMTIPLSFIEAGGCPLPVYPACPHLQRLFEPENPVIPVRSEAALGQHFAAATMIPVTMLLLEEAARWLGEQCGDMRAAEIYVAALLSGYLAEVPQDGNGRFSEAVEELATEGGISAQIVNHLRDADVLVNLRDGLTMLGQRLRRE